MTNRYINNLEQNYRPVELHVLLQRFLTEKWHLPLKLYLAVLWLGETAQFQSLKINDFLIG